MKPNVSDMSTFVKSNKVIPTAASGCAFLMWLCVPDSAHHSRRALSPPRHKTPAFDSFSFPFSFRRIIASGSGSSYLSPDSDSVIDFWYSLPERSGSIISIKRSEIKDQKTPVPLHPMSTLMPQEATEPQTDDAAKEGLH